MFEWLFVQYFVENVPRRDAILMLTSSLKRNNTFNHKARAHPHIIIIMLAAAKYRASPTADRVLYSTIRGYIGNFLI